MQSVGEKMFESVRYCLHVRDGLDCKISVSQSSLKKVMVAHGDLRREGTLDIFFLRDMVSIPQSRFHGSSGGTYGYSL